jgi:uncharacterized damage-inducible protein DinB
MFATLEARTDILKMLDDLTQVRKGILQRCAKLTEQQLHDPVYPGTWSVLQNLAHLAWAEEFMLAWILRRPEPLAKEQWPQEPALTLDEVTFALDEAHAATIAFVKGHDEAVLRERCQYVPNRGEQTVGGLLFHIIEHEIGHRTFILHKLQHLEVKGL